MQKEDRVFEKRMTTTYVGALTALAVLAAVGYYVPQAELRIQQSSAAVLNRIDRQNTLLEHTALLAESFVTAPSREKRERFRQELLQEAERMEAAHTVLVAGHPRLRLPVELDQQVRDYLAKARTLADAPEAERGLDNALFQFIFTEATGSLADNLEAVALEYQKHDEAGIQRLRQVQFGALAGTISALALLGVFVFRPMVRRVQRDQEDRLRSERLAVIGTMAAKFAHEIRNPLGSIRLNLDSLRENLAPTLAPALLNSIDSELRRIQRISDGYLQFARLPPTTRQPLRLHDWLPEELRFHEPLLQQQGIALRTEFDSAVPAVSADKTQLGQALLNLVRNAVDAMPGGGTLTVRTARNGTTALLSLADTGHGMNAEQKARIFQPFFTSRPGGTGLGLALTQQIVLEHDGRIECASVAGQGTTFTIHLPLAKEIADETQANRSAH